MGALSLPKAVEPRLHLLQLRVVLPRWRRQFRYRLPVGVKVVPESSSWFVLVSIWFNMVLWIVKNDRRAYGGPFSVRCGRNRSTMIFNFGHSDSVKGSLPAKDTAFQ